MSNAVPAGTARRGADLTAAAAASCRCCAAPILRCVPARSWRWWRRPAPASPRCCIWPACWKSRMAAACSSAAAMPARWAMPSAPRSAATASASSISSIICSAEFTALENIVLPQMIAGQIAPRRRAAGAGVAGRVRPGGAGGSSARQAVGRRAAAGGDRARDGQCPARAAGRRAHRQSRCRHGGGGVRGIAARGARRRAWRR